MFSDFEQFACDRLTVPTQFILDALQDGLIFLLWDPNPRDAVLSAVRHQKASRVRFRGSG